MNIHRTVMLAAVFVTLVGMSESKAGATRDYPWGIRESIQWRNADGKMAESLTVTEYSAERAVTRMIVEAPNGQKLILTYEVSPQKGESSARIETQNRAWFVQLEKVSEMKLDSMDDYFKPASYAEKFRQEDRRVTFAVKAQGIETFEFSLSEWDDLQAHKLYNGLQHADRIEALVRLIDSDLKDALRFLWEASRPVDCHGGMLPFSPLAELMYMAFDHDRTGFPTKDPPERQSWVPETSGVRKGTSLEDAHELDFAERFSCVNSSAPLLGYHNEVSAAEQ